MTNNSQMTVAGSGFDRTMGNGRDTVMGMNGWVDIQLAHARERLGRIARQRAGADAPSLRVRFGAAVAAWKQPGKVSAA